jgi:hypothetical protein
MLKKSVLGLFAAIIIFNVVMAVLYLTRTLNRDLSIPDTVIEFQEAVYGGNYEAMWDLSAEPYRAGRTRDDFLEWARQNAPPLTRIFDWTVLDERTDGLARAHTRMQLAGDGVVMHELMLTRVEDEWKVTQYREYSGEWPPDEPPLADAG